MTDQEDQIRQTIRGLFSEVPNEHTAAMQRLAALSSLFHQELARAAEPLVNTHLATLPQDDLESKRKLVRDLNQELSKLRLSIQFPQTDQPALMTAHWRDHHDTVGRFRLEVRNEKGGRDKTFTSNTLPKLRLMEHPIRAEAGSHASKTRREPRER